MRHAFFALALLACGTSPGRTENATQISEDDLAEESLSEGSCGGFGELEPSEPLALLAGRLRVRGPDGAADVPRPHDIMAAPPAAEMESRLFLEHDGARFVILATELFRTPTEDLVAAARADIGDRYRVASLDVGAPLRAAIAIPRELDASDDAVDVATVYTVTADQLVQRVEFYVTPDAAADGGCERVALGLARTLEVGGRSLPDEPGPRVLEGTIGIDLPSAHRVMVEEGPDFSVYRVYPALPLGHGAGSLGIYVGHHPSMHPREGATTAPGTIAGRAVEWQDATEDGVRSRQTLAELAPHHFAHVFFASDDPAVFDRLQAIAESLREGVTPPPLAACPDAAPLPAVEVAAEVLAIPALQTLLRAEEFATYRRTWDVSRVETAEAFFTLSAHPRAQEAFLYLAVHGTTAGKVYGLIGLYHQDRDRFEEVVCAVASVLDPQVTVRRACGTERVSVAAIVERPDGARGQRHFTPSQWSAALSAAPADIRGGGLAWEMVLGPRDGHEISTGGWEIGGEGWAPSLEASDRSAAAMPAFAPAEHTVRTSLTQAGGVCRTRADGRVACWGSTPASELAGARLLPEWVRWPRQIAVDLGLGCVLDANGQRACFALIDRTLDARTAACPGNASPSGVVMRRFDDGPWRALYVAGDVCGVAMDGSLRCFRSSLEYAPQWAEIEGIGIGSGYAVPIPGDVRGVASAYLGSSVAWTADGTIWEWSNYDAPHIAGRVEGVVDVTGGNDGAWLFARTDDGSVFVRGMRGSEYWSSFPDDHGPFVEVPALRGVGVWLEDHHGCTLSNGTVRCWGQRAGFLPERSDEDGALPDEVPTLHGARSLWLGEWMTCGDMPNGSWRCIGNHQASLSNHPVEEERRAPYDVRLDRIAAAIR